MRRIGMLAPLLNTVLEPYTMALVVGIPDVGVPSSRFAVTEMSLERHALAQFDLEPIGATARRFGDAEVHSILWNGTSAAWLGFEGDHEVAGVIGEATGAPRWHRRPRMLGAALRRGGLRAWIFRTPA